MLSTADRVGTGRSPARHDMTRYATLAARRLRDGQWHDYEEVVRDLVLHVPPGEAKREAEHARVYLAQRRAAARGVNLPAGDVPPRARPADGDRLWQSGARTIIRRALYRDGFETRVVRGHKQVRAVG